MSETDCHFVIFCDAFFCQKALLSHFQSVISKSELIVKPNHSHNLIFSIKNAIFRAKSWAKSQSKQAAVFFLSNGCYELKKNQCDSRWKHNGGFYKKDMNAVAQQS